MIHTSQRGVSLLGVMIVGAFAAFLLIVAFRTVPVFNEYMAIKRIVGILANDIDNGTSVIEARRNFDRRKSIDDVSSVSGADLVIDRSGGKTVVEVQYARTVPLVANVSLLFELNPSSEVR